MIGGVTLPASTSRSIESNSKIYINEKKEKKNPHWFLIFRIIGPEIMSQNTEGRRDVCRDSFEEKHLQEYLERVADILNISHPKYRIKLGTKIGDNYGAFVYRVSFEGEKEGVPVKIHTIFKVPPKDEARRVAMLISYFFPREHVFYTEIVPIFKEFLQTKNKSLENIAQCYFSCAVDRKEVICLEDLKAKGFVMRDRIKQMDFAHISLALRVLGRLHALSFALRDQRPEVFESKITMLEETLFRREIIEDPDFSHRFEQLGDLVKTALAEEDPRYMERFSQYMKDALNDMEWSSEGKTAEPYAVLGHGDFWINNILFKYNEGCLEPEEIYLLDFQLARYASPVVDISYILFCNCSQELRKRHFDELIKIYHESLSAYLLELGSDPKKLFPYDALLDQVKKFSINGAGLAILVLPIFTSQGHDDQEFDVDNGDLPRLQERIRRDHFWRNTTKDTFKDLIDRNFI